MDVRRGIRSVRSGHAAPLANSIELGNAHTRACSSFILAHSSRRVAFDHGRAHDLFMNIAMDELRALVMRADDTWTPTGIPRVTMVRAEACANQVYHPMLHLVLQGTKTLSIGDQLLTYAAGSYFLVPVDLPATGEIQASVPGQPYLAICLTPHRTPIALRRSLRQRK
jgi:hypothetical protein